MTGLSYVNYTVTPLTEPLVGGSFLYRLAQGPYLAVYLPLTLFVLSMELYDRYNLMSSVPLATAYALLFTCAYQRARGLRVPLWFGKQLTRVSAFAAFTSLFTGYCMLVREIQTSEARVVFTNI